ncbi:MAG: hypothetical protein ACK5NA_08415 [Enterococcus sp.]
MENSTESIKLLASLLEEGFNITNEPLNAFYMICGAYIEFESCDGIRGEDHNALAHNGYTFVDLLNLGTVIVPETRTYLSDTEIYDLDVLGYTAVPITK